jgi:hypothetical protein
MHLVPIAVHPWAGRNWQLYCLRSFLGLSAEGVRLASAWRKDAAHVICHLWHMSTVKCCAATLCKVRNISCIRVLMCLLTHDMPGLGLMPMELHSSRSLCTWLHSLRHVPDLTCNASLQLHCPTLKRPLSPQLLPQLFLANQYWWSLL